jgi:anaerobic magnesium-protoporphyrin IX monomethyl ester cyclase
MMIRTALISFLVNSINTRTLSAYLKANGCPVVCVFWAASLNSANLDKLVNLLRAQQIDLVGLSLVTDDYRSAVIVTQAVKTRLGLPVIWGGAHPNVRPEESLRHADMICLGEGEEALLELVQAMSRQTEPLETISNIWFRTPDGIGKNELRFLEEDLDRYPFPDFDFHTQYVLTDAGLENLGEAHLRGAYSIMTSRGCPYSCRYCYNNYRRQHYQGKGKYLRARSIENVVAELAQAKATFKNLKLINFWDDSFVSRPMRDFGVFKTRYIAEVNLPFFALIEPMAFNREKIAALKECGLSKLQIGIQTGSERVNREIYGRRVTNRETLEMAHYLHDLGLEVIYDLIFNNPYETPEDVHQTINLLLQFRRPFSVQGYNLIFYPETEITERALKDGYLSPKPEAEEDFSTIENRHDSPMAMEGKGTVSSRFYNVHFDTCDKEYLNAVISMMAFRQLPPRFIQFFSRSESPAKRLMLKSSIRLLTWAARAKNALMPRPVA